MLHEKVNDLSRRRAASRWAYNAGAIWVTRPEKKPMMSESAVQESGR